MKTLINIAASAALLAASALPAASATPSPALPDTVTASDAFVAMPAQTLDLLTRSMRLDMLEYWKIDSIADIANTMEGFSHLCRPVTDDGLKVQVTPVTTLTIRILPTRKGRIAATVYTIGDSLQAADSEIRFYDAEMNELKRDRFIKTPSSEDFFDFKGVDHKLRKELLSLVPFPTVEYTLSPDGTDLKARLTVGKYMGREDLEKITPYLRRDRVYHWTGSKYIMAE